MPVLRKILVANRGEIARRIFVTCRRLGFSTVGITSDVDRFAPHLSLADEVVQIGGTDSQSSYLSIDKIVDAARKTGADAIHPGYGFLAENTAFAQRCEDEGILFIGPSAETIRVMGSKILSKQRVSAFGVPTIPGYAGPRQDTAFLVETIRDVGFPCLIKASAGGGGKGMRRLDDDYDLVEQIEMSRREAEKAFGDGTLFIERWIDRPRHIEVQILGDVFGNVVHLFERECSIQRRHQKIVEESPSSALSPELRSDICQAAINVARSVSYVNAGTVEFVLAPNGEWYFLEMNTRLQVEHPVTEMVLGLDLVELQLLVAQGRSLADILPPPVQRGVAIECRLYAEDPAVGYLPSIGTLVDWYIPSFEGIRLDSGVETGSEVSVYYDPMLAKLVAWGPDRAVAARRMATALRYSSICGVSTNRQLLHAIVSHPLYGTGEIHTGFLEEQFGLRPAFDLSRQMCVRAAILAAAAGHQQRQRGKQHVPGLISGYRNNRGVGQQVTFLTQEHVISLEYIDLGAGKFEFRVNDDAEMRRMVQLREAVEAPSITEANSQARTWSLTIDHLTIQTRVVITEQGTYVRFATGELIVLREQPRFPEQSTSHQLDNRCVSPMPGKVAQIHVAVGQSVSAGDLLVTIEAMKMEHAVRAPHAGVVQEILVLVSDQVAAHQPVVVVAEP
ncbi:MAG: biotin/lipoyl-binding protein [Myxococcales bacterium]|nr:biotin/lipoyl-binding protein [Myxococcales bacterium]